ncbi:hypothetical protein [Curtobacterium flaccumfaciens]|uniref:hypothetical protein n=1 Tax=Curtobacterium flaccumfaciens TaxID=2035 RepID=UPI001BDEC5A0|nr:hypothetical protein [Curtobacterium flaccumfaciens]MBT1605308.1 hypothetical protein [Curtobacterium flaccumfaciens pv. betae]MBT1655583.1 hypothetical protein [Curtobacterium flaccumfaciens pv. betae]MCS0470468.1 hypothetical protein [Curtobacterium flaccumfaciens pv. betae]MCS0473832.1 hypothetical protein [Curtobacterium flaccumfaciens pv. betae]MCS0478663.1 hypothetical protein [Curtobacterium flaccumfaciens pv. betae]
MRRISDFYGITGSLPFVDVDLDDDNRLYVDPHAIRLMALPSPFAPDAVSCLDTFFDAVTSRIILWTPSALKEGEALLQKFSEPRETRLGMAAAGFRGHGGALKVGTDIWNALIGDVRALIRVGVMKQVEDIPLFVEGVDNDITSDLTTRIIFGPLAAFTADMIVRYPQFRTGGDGVKTFERQVWDPSSKAWTTAEVELPVVDGEPLLLVPVGWARPRILMSARRFWSTTILSYAQLGTMVVLNGKEVPTPKDVLKKQKGFGPGRRTNIRITKQAIESTEDLVKAFKKFVDGKF